MPKNQVKNFFFFFLVLIVLVAVGIFLLRERGVEVGDLSRDLSTPSGGKVDSSISEKILQSGAYLEVDLEDVSGGDSFGMAFILRDQGKLYHLVIADLSTPRQGYSYEGWLVNSDTNDFFSTGVMDEKAGDWILEFESDSIYQDYNLVVITLESVVDEIPEDHILEGEFII